MVRFTVYGQPVSQNACYKRSRQGRMFMSPEGKAWKKAVSDMGLLAVAPNPPYDGSVAVRIDFYYQSRRNDLDGGLKPTLDALAPHVMLNDRQVVEIHIFKHLDREKPRAEIAVEAVA